MNAAHGNSTYHRLMAQRPDPLLKELAFFRRVLASQKRELAQIIKRSVRRDRSRETLETRAEIRKTGQVIMNLRAEMGKRDGDTHPGDGGTTPERRSARPPSLPPPTPSPPLPDVSAAAGVDNPAAAGRETPQSGGP